MKYVETPGIVRTKICGQTVLLPTRAASGRCKTARVLPMLWAGTYNSICRGAPMEKILTVHRIFMKQKTDEQILAEVEAFCERLCAEGFLTRVEDDPADPQISAPASEAPACEAAEVPASSAAPMQEPTP